MLFAYILSIAVCVLEIVIPFYVAYHILKNSSLSQPTYFIGAIIALAILIAIRKPCGDLISGAWNYGDKLLKNALKPIGLITEGINSIFERLKNWVGIDD